MVRIENLKNLTSYILEKTVLSIICDNWKNEDEESVEILKTSGSIEKI